MSKRRYTPRQTWGFLRLLLPRLAPFKSHLFVAGILLLMATAIGLAFPLVVKELLDSAFIAGDPRLVNTIALGLLALFALQAVINFCQSYLTASTSERVVATLRKDLFDALIHQSPGFFDTRRVGELTSRISSDTGLVQGVLRFGVPELIRQGVFLVGAVVLVTITDPHLTLVTLIAIPITALVGWLLGRRVRRLSTRIQDRLADAVARAEQVFTQIQTVQGFTREKWEKDRFTAEVDQVRNQGLKRAVVRAGLTGAITFSAFGAIVLVLWEGGHRVLDGVLTAGDLVAFLLYAVTIAGAIMSLAGFYGNLQEAAGAAERIFEMVRLRPGLRSPDAPAVLPDPVEGEVSFENVRFRYGPDLPLVLDGIDVAIGKGERVALVGSSGAGKSTMASLIPRFYDVEEGRVALDGLDVRTLGLRDLRSQIGIVPQEPMLFAGTVFENIAYGRDGATTEEVEGVARLAHAEEFIARFPDGFDQVVGERGVTLSAGQRQRIAIARVMLRKPAVLILDEASSSLDAESEALVQDALDHLMAGRTTVVIAHRLSTVIRADEILVLDGGTIVDRGKHEDLLERSGVYQKLYQRQFDDALASTRSAKA